MNDEVSSLQADKYCCVPAKDGDDDDAMPFHMYRITKVVMPGDVIPKIDIRGSEFNDVDMDPAQRASSKLLVGVRYKTIPDVADRLTPIFKKGCKKKEACYLLKATDVLGFPGGGFHCNKTGINGYTRKVPHPISAAIHSSKTFENTPWKYDFKKKKWVREETQCSSSDSSDSSDSSSSESD